MISAAIAIQEWMITLCRAAFTAAGFNDPALRVVIVPRQDTASPYAYVAPPDEREDVELSDSTNYACEAHAAVALMATDETGGEMGVLLDLAQRIINGAAAQAPPTDWNMILLQLEDHSDLENNDPNVIIYGRTISFKMNLTRPRP